MKKPLEKILNYFTGRDVLQYYSDIEKKSPDFYEEAKLGKQKTKSLMLCSIIPNILDVGAVVYLTITKDYFGGAFAFGASEAIRSECRNRFQYVQQLGNAYKLNTFVCKKTNEINDEVKILLEELIKKLESGELKLKRKKIK